MGDLTRLFSVPLSAPASEQAALAVSPIDGAVWLAANHELVNVNAAGVVGSSLLAGTVVTLEVDPQASVLWVATEGGVAALDLTSGATLRTLPLAAAERVADLRVELGSGKVWVALAGEVRLYDSGGTLLRTTPLAGAVQVAAAGEGAAWIATAKTLRYLDPQGALGLAIDPFDGRAIIVALAVAGDSTVWVANPDTIAHYRADGALLHRLTFQPSIHVRDLAVNTDGHPPQPSIVAPTTGACLKTLSPSFDLTFSDLGWGVDPATLSLTANGLATEVSCLTSGTGATCSVVSPLPAGAVTFSWTVADFAANVSPAASVQSILDATAPQITIISPTDGLVTAEPTITLVGTLSEAAILTIAGQAVEVGSDLGWSRGPLSLTEGENTFELVATDCAGNAVRLEVLGLVAREAVNANERSDHVTEQLGVLGQELGRALRRPPPPPRCGHFRRS